ncbi:MAG: DNA topoisomerase VI subunit B [Candidatus Aenigmarchaeota archaeon]|nr:DNA topoisomerase VI subunit B [Candidatus Aenigmarchaeota archaeon]
MAKEQRAISVAEFFEKNRHLLGFDNPMKALLIVVKEMVDNSLDACEEAGILPEITVKLKTVGEDRIKVSVQDNGPGIVKSQIPRIFGKLLYGSKFGKMVQGRGQQGIGVCMTPDTLVNLSDGRVKTIEDLVENEYNSKVFVTAPDLKLVPLDIKKFWKIPSPKKLIKIKTLGGREITLTPENPILVRKENGIDWKTADTLVPGDYISASRKINIKNNNRKIPILDLLEKKTIRADCYNFLSKILYKLRKKYGTWEKVSKKHNISVEKIKGWLKKSIRRRPTISELEALAKDAGFSESDLIKNVRRIGRLGTYVEIPEYVTKDLLWFAGVIAGDGNIQMKREDRWGINITLWNNNEEILKRFRNILKKLFSIEGRKIYHSKGRGMCIEFSSKIVSEILEKLGVPAGKKAKIFTIPEIIQKLPDKYLSSYIQGLFDAEGSVDMVRKNVSIMLTNTDVLRKLNLLLLRYGIFARFNRANRYYRIIISGQRNLKLFKKYINFGTKDKRNKLKIMIHSLRDEKSNIEVVPHMKETLKSVIEELGISYYQLKKPNIVSSIRQGCALNYSTLKDLSAALLKKCNNEIPLGIQEMLCLLDADITWLKVTDVKEIDPPYSHVYDITMKKGNNFLANGLVVHNSAALLYAQLTTGKPTIVRSSTGKGKVHELIIRMDTSKNEPQILKDELYDKKFPDHGTYIEMEIEGKYRKGSRSVDEYIKQTAIANPFAKIVYQVDKDKIVYPRVVSQLPKKAIPIKPHPHGVELGVFERIVKNTNARTIKACLMKDFSRVGSTLAEQVLKLSKIKPSTKPQDLTHQDIEKIWRQLQKSKIMNPPLICISPIGQDILEKSVKKDLKPEFTVAITRPPSVYRGNPFQIECCIGYGGELPPNAPAKIMRFANKVPLLYQSSSCAITKAIQKINWRPYHVEQQGGMPYGPIVIAVHMASVWIPYTSESKEAIDPYPEIEKEIKLAIQDCARKLQRYLAGRKRRQLEAKRKGLFEKYIPEVVNNLALLTGEKEAVIRKYLENLINKGVENGSEEETETIREEAS